MRNFVIGLVLGMVVLPAIALAAGLLGFFSTQATSEPPRLEKAVAQRGFSASVARHAPRQANPIAPTEENLRAGLLLFRNNCAGCHGDSNQRSDWGSRNFYPRVPQFGFEHPQKPDWQMFWIVKNGVRYSGMGAWDRQLPDEKIWQVVTFLSRLDALPPPVAERWQKGPQN
jgi:thiosulfate dehydrogenase